MDINNGILVYYQDGWVKVDEITDGVWTERQSKWVGKLNPNKMLEINPNYQDYVVIGLPNTNKENTMQWFNFQTNEFDSLEKPKTDEEAICYIPNIPAAHGLFKVHRMMGKSIEEALIETLTSCIGNFEPESNTEPTKLKKWWQFWR